MLQLVRVRYQLALCRRLLQLVMPLQLVLPLLLRYHQRLQRLSRLQQRVQQLLQGLPLALPALLVQLTRLRLNQGSKSLQQARR